MCGQLKSETIQCQRHARLCPPYDDDDDGLEKFTLHYAVPKRGEKDGGDKTAVYSTVAS